jgi:hypothetical protein
MNGLAFLAVVLSIGIGGPLAVLAFQWIGSKLRPDCYASPFGDVPRLPPIDPDRPF